MDNHDPKLRSIWKQKEVPVIYRQPSPSPVFFKVSYSDNNYEWVRGEKRHKPRWNQQYKCWETPVAWFDYLIERTLKRYGQVYVIQSHKEQQKCAPACWNATGFHCECSCMGANHGSGDSGAWYEVSETFAFQWGERQYACRLITTTNRKGLTI